ncbi:MAG: hypothetical protein ACE5J9_02960, partial [Methanosarcinales archaeon]
MMRNKLLFISLIVIILVVLGFYYSKLQSPNVPSSEQRYKYVTEKPTGWFKTGQDADIMLSGIDFNNTGGALLFNHPKGIATDGMHLLLADTYNNRILIWNKLPQGNQPPDLVLGQKNFISNNPGKNLDELNWPVGVAITPDGKVLVADTENDRILIWNSFPNKNGQPADIVFQGSEKKGINARGNIIWPWAVWTDGKKVVVASTGSGQVLIWNNFPTKNNQPADNILQLKEFGTPRSIGSDGKHLAIGDHNAPGGQGTFMWKNFPARDDKKYDFLLSDPEETLRQETPGNEAMERQMLWSIFDEEGRFIALGNRVYIWKDFPENENVAPDYIIGTKVPSDQRHYFYGGGDGSDLAAVGKRLYLVLSNGNKIVGFNELPTKKDERPGFAIGSPDIDTNTLNENFFITNPLPATDGKRLFVTSDYDNKLYIWKNLPDESGAKPDIVYNDIGNAWDNALFGNTFAVAGGREVRIWKTLPLNGEGPDLVFKDSIGNVRFQEIKGIAIDDKYFYLADHQANKVYVWKGIPDKTSNPKIVLKVPSPWRLSSDGKYLAVDTIFDHSVHIYKVDELSQNSQPRVIRSAGGFSEEREVTSFNLPEMALVSNGKLFIADTVFNRLLVWKNIEDAISGKRVDVILGE